MWYLKIAAAGSIVALAAIIVLIGIMKILSYSQ
jgi:hypothetical protein